MKKNLLKTLVLVSGLLLSTNGWAQLVPSYVGDAYSTGDDCYVITPNLQQQAGALWYDNPIDLNADFDIVFNGFFGSNDGGADGMSFVLKTTSDPIIGIPGGGLGYQELPETPSLAVEFDTYQNSGGVINDPYYDHVALQKNGNTNHNSPNSLVSYVQASATSTNIENNIEHQVKIQWRAAEQTFTLVFDCSERFTYTSDLINTVFEGASTVYFGFTGSTGDATNLQSICFEYLSFLESSLQDETICAGSSITDIDGTYVGALNYQWSPATGVSDPDIPNPVFTPSVTTTYTLTTTDNCGQTMDQDVTITVVPNPDVTVVADDSSVCSGEDAVFNFTGTPGSEVTYTLNTGDEQTILLDAAGVASLSVVASSQQVLQLVNVALLEAPFCEANVTDSVTVDITAGDASFSMDPDCQGATATITGDVGGVFTFNPIPTDGAVIDIATGTISNGVQGATYFVEYSVSGSCSASSIEQVTLFPAVSYNEPLALSVCESDILEFDLSMAIDQIEGGNTDLVITFYETATEAGTGSTMAQLPLLYATTDQESELWVRIENTTTGCYSVVALPLGIKPLPVLVQVNDIEACDDDNDGFAIFDLTTVASQVAGSPDVVLTYAYENNGVFTTIISPEAFQNTTADVQTIQVTGENSLGCSSSVSFNIIVNKCFIQRGISPNSDGMNDSFDLTGYNVKELSVFNRYGVKVYTASNYTNQWHGQSDNGNELPTGTYFYSINVANENQMSGQQKTGWIYVNREIN
ncbi:T9SS type B sorting domain-containing protein [Flavobacterium arcticum]|nr:gliding motility-associated C-terminal domain-containing protein [Flavobacterium arcticum]KAF2510988.1 T9SS type B sorting domain-containing protein [Flavobacterium arcticum]